MRLAVIDPNDLVVMNIIEAKDRFFPVPAPLFTVESDTANIGDRYEDSGVFIPVLSSTPEPEELELPLELPE